MTEQKFGQPMPRAEQIRANVFPTPEQIPGGFFSFIRDVNGGECAGSIENSELARIATIGLDPVAGTAGNQRRGNDLAWNRARSQCALHRKPARPRFVAAVDRPPAL
jgi:hypothetical protein